MDGPLPAMPSAPVANFMSNARTSFANTARRFAKEIALLLVIVGALNWGAHAIFDLDLVEELKVLISKIPLIGGASDVIGRIVYITIAVSAIYVLYERFIATGGITNICI